MESYQWCIFFSHLAEFAPRSSQEMRASPNRANAGVEVLSRRGIRTAATIGTTISSGNVVSSGLSAEQFLRILIANFLLFVCCEIEFFERGECLRESELREI